MVQYEFTRIADYVVATDAKAFADEFLDGGDPWLVACSLAFGGGGGSLETLANLPNPDRRTGQIASKVKIPSICTEFGLQASSLPQMLRALGINDL